MNNLEKNNLDIEQEMTVQAPIQSVFKSMITHLSSEYVTDDGQSLVLELEEKPGGRWYRNLGENRGHLWGFVQSIMEPNLLELRGPLFMSGPFINHIIIRFKQVEMGTHVRFHHRSLGEFDEKHTERIANGWKKLFEHVTNCSTLLTTQEK